ncbi:MAG: flavodoxin family protein [Thermodesulfobacteriota bacterium]
MYVVAINGSARENGNTALLLGHVLAELSKEGIRTGMLQLSGKQIRGCAACMKCFERRDRRCAIAGDAANECIEKMDAADGILLGSPTYFTDVTAEMKALIERAGMVGRANGDMYRRKVGAAVVAG